MSKAHKGPHKWGKWRAILIVDSGAGPDWVWRRECLCCLPSIKEDLNDVNLISGILNRPAPKYRKATIRSRADVFNAGGDADILYVRIPPRKGKK